ncbi:L10-interacting MYB domain-containing protein [Camellia lanceoleosa]|uniref:L10-interacting MYB domain-containing protein n=1 Tax=Camellia lanceoleosa TaxID=1840588 RepID=A0ACC0IMP6_9ERIC|nr:L10-interacting MYB domain-containing protein [Camellia lanceoleosa]
MGCQTPMSSERLRTYWTPAMERYFIDLMLDHMHRGNRVGHTFNKQAWADMLSMFSAKFGTQHDKDILKNRYSTLWKQFNDVKNLLDQSGFSWDDTQQMVVAEDYVWDTYTKAHSDAQYYRNKPLMNFSDLCLIYAYATADGRYSRSSHDIDFDDEIQGLNIGEGKEAQAPSFSNCTRTFWTLPVDHYLIDLLLDQVLRGNKIGHAFITQAWNEMVKSFNSKFGSHYDKEVLKSRYKHLREQYNDLKILLDQNGFSWDETQEMVTAEEYVWDSYTKAYPDAQLYKFKTVPSYHKLCVIYGEEGSNGKPNSEDLDDSDCSRTDWTPSMDRCLIDLLLKQVHKGQNINHIFDEQVWMDIVAAFNDRFGSQHDKYVLKGQYKSLKKLYHDMKNLLELGEFSWDESRQMVTGPDDVWDAYTKENPDGTSFRTKTMPNYNDLCLVYGNLTSEGRWNQSDPYVGFNGDGRDFQASQNGSCLRSGWTAPMDRYFIDLMLEQIRKGNMIDQNFNKQAWGDMVAKFVAKFGSKHHKDVLESRFEKMRNLFHDMRTLIDQSGFAWDEMQQMVTASNDIWDAYIKERPDAQSFRSRTLPNYNDLFLIFGNTSTNGRSDHASHCTNIDDGALKVNIYQEDDQSSSGSDTSSIAWTKPMDRYFIDLMLGQVFEGNRVENIFNKQAWVCMIASFNEKFGLQFDKCVLENRYLSLMKQYDDISTLLNKNGFAWDEIEQKVTADDDYWEAYIEEHPDAVAYKDIILENYCDLSIIFGDEIHDGTSSYLCPEMNIDDNALEMGMDGIFGALKSPAIDNEVSNGRKRRQSTTPLSSTHGRKIKKTGEELQEAGRSNTLDRNYSSIESIVDALQAVPDMHDELFLDACDLLEDEKKAKAFVKMDILHRKKWLLRNLHA